MSAPQFDIRIDTSGKLTVKVSGVSGEECMRLSDMLAQIVGREVSREKTSEYYAPGSVRITTPQQVHGRTK
ncbi:MAG: DUF2997 domain-containing protein [Planctomycetota bacterium]|nr:DUF2997 domain-containing protein [Planctomycetota bacterium]